jgi:hypothetical protein
MVDTASLPSKNEDVLSDLIARNQGETGLFFRKLLTKDLGIWERRVLALLSRSQAYRGNDLARLLELANDLREANQGQIRFVDKYTDELFLPGAADKEEEESDFLDTAVIPFLTRLIQQRKGQNL